jgi:hypothetical protein
VNFLEMFVEHFEAAQRAALELESLEQFSRRVEQVPALTDCPHCGATPLRLAGSSTVQCRCGWRGVVLRPLP